MGSMSSILSFLPVVRQGLDLAFNMAGREADHHEARQEQAQALRQLQRRQQENIRQMEDDTALERSRLLSQTEEAERRRRQALKNAVARQRANFGASGISSKDGSGEAVLLGLFEESDAERQERERLDTLKLNALGQDIDRQRRLNLIQRTQLQERQKLGSLSSGLDRARNLANFGVDAAQLYGKIAGA